MRRESIKTQERLPVGMKHKLKPGWTKAKVLEQFTKYNDGTLAKEDRACVFRTRTGNRCAIGAFLPDGEWLMARCGVKHLLKKYPALREYLPFDNEASIISFQLAHDSPSVASVYRSVAKFIDEECEEAG